MCKTSSKFNFFMFIILMFVSQTQNAENHKTIDSLKNVLTKSADIESRIHLLKNIANEYTMDFDSSVVYGKRALDLIDENKLDLTETKAKLHALLADKLKISAGNSERIYNRKEALKLFKQSGNEDEYIINTLYLGNDFFVIGEQDSLVFYLNKVKDKIENKPSKRSTNIYYSLRGNYCIKTGKYLKGIEYFEKNIKDFEKKEASLQHRFNISSETCNISSCYINLEDYNKSLEYAFRADSLFIDDQFPIDYKVNMLNNIAVSYLEVGKHKKAIEYLGRILDLKPKIRNLNLIVAAHLSISRILKDENNLSKALNHLNKAEDIMEQEKLKFYYAQAMNNKASLLIEMNDLDQAQTYIKRALARSIEIQDTSRILRNKVLLLEYNLRLKKWKRCEEIYADIYPELIETNSYVLARESNRFLMGMAESQNDLSDFKKYLELYVVCNDSVNYINNRIKFKEIETKYETEKKEQQIKVLQLEDEKNQLTIAKAEQMNYAMMGGLALFMLVLIPSGLYYKKHKESKFLIGKLSAREEESSDIAKDLHDSVASQLSYVHSFISKQGADENLVKLVKNVRDEVRTISHKLNINNLAKLSFKEALYDGLNLANQHPDIDIKIALSPQDLNISDENIKKNTIRIIQELLENTIKHAEASKVSLRVFEEDEKIILSYKDNGMGYDMDLVKEGHGLMNLKDRVKSISGKMKYHSAPNQGVKVNITV